MTGSSSCPVRLGVVGAGSHSRSQHGSALAEIRLATPQRIAHLAVCDVERAKAEAYAADFGFDAVFQDLEAMVSKSNLDGLVLVTPIPLTCELGCRLLERGIPLLIEKPPGRSVKETQRLVAAARSSGTPHMLSFNRRFSPALSAAREWLTQTGRQDNIRLVNAWMTRVRRTEAQFMPGTGIHIVDTVLSLLPAPDDVRVCRTHPPGSAAAWQISLQGGSLGSITVAPDAGCAAEVYQLLGPRFSVTVDTAACTMQAFLDGKRAESWNPPRSASTAYTSGGVNEMTAFIDAVTGRGPFFPSLREGLAAMRICEEAQGGIDGAGSSGISTT